MAAAQNIKVIDLACGSGAFLAACYSALLRAWTQASVSIDELEQKTPDLGLFGEDPTKLLRSSLYGSDRMPQAIEISKLALWLRSARKGEKVADLGHNLVTADSLDLGRLAGGLGLDVNSLASFDLVIGNPPWGAEVDAGVARALAERLGLDPNHSWDSWELFVALGIALLRRGGRISLVLPDTVFSPAKAAIRAHINAQLQARASTQSRPRLVWATHTHGHSGSSRPALASGGSDQLHGDAPRRLRSSEGIEGGAPADSGGEPARVAHSAVRQEPFALVRN